jgi:hypothetical protein
MTKIIDRKTRKDRGINKVETVEKTVEPVEMHEVDIVVQGQVLTLKTSRSCFGCFGLQDPAECRACQKSEIYVYTACTESAKKDAEEKAKAEAEKREKMEQDLQILNAKLNAKVAMLKATMGITELEEALQVKAPSQKSTGRKSSRSAGSAGPSDYRRIAEICIPLFHQGYANKTIANEHDLDKKKVANVRTAFYAVRGESNGKMAIAVQAMRDGLVPDIASSTRNLLAIVLDIMG